jgi:tetratricopeptide (TPR) repeat protein
MTRSSARASRAVRASVRVAAALVGVLVGLGHGVARAQSGAEKAMAEQLFEAGRTLIKQGKHAEACPKFEASFALDPALGTQLNLARCYERLGKLASAWGHYREAAGRAKQAGQSQRERAARSFAAALEPRLPRLVIRVPEGSVVAGLEVSRDGTAVSRALFDNEIYIDPGEHQVSAVAPGRERFTITVTAKVGEREVVEIPALAPRAARAGDATEAGEASPSASAGPSAGEPRPGDGRRRRTLGLGLGGGGIAFVAGGVGFALAARSAWDDAFESGECVRDMLVCTPAGQERTDAARTRALMADILVGTGIALAVTGAVLYLTAPDGGPVRERAAGGRSVAVPMLWPGAVGVEVTGSF